MIDHMLPRTKRYCFVFCIIALLLSSCTMALNPSLKNGPEIIDLTGDGLILTWEYPLAGTSVSSFDIAYAATGGPISEDDWTVIATIPASSSFQFDMGQASLPKGDWVIGILAKDNAGKTSSWHSSLATDSIPSTGWIVRKL